MWLFENHDLVILCERSHMEVTQYQLLAELMADERFTATVGHIFTEVGTSNIRGKVEAFLTDTTLTKQAIEDKLLDIYRNLTWFPLWEKTNYFDFLKQVHTLNCSLPAERMIHIHPSDMPFSWEGMTAAAYQEFEKTLEDRDRIMADEVEKKFREIQAQDSRKKALVIMNYRHAFNDFPLHNGEKINNTGRFLFERFPGKVANVFINGLALLPGTTDQQTFTKPIQDGKWDAAFDIMGNIECGFNLARTPFGQDSFDLFPFTEHQARYQDVFTGMIFFMPLNRHKEMIGIPGMFDESFRKTFAERMAISGQPLKAAALDEIAAKMNQIRERPYENIEELNDAIQKWLPPADQN
jgi:hypothetical protein